MSSKNVVIGVLVLCVVLLGIQNVVLRNTAKGLKKQLVVMEENFKQQLTVERTQVKKDMREKYQADRVSYEAMGKATEELREKLRKAEEKLEEAK